MQLHEALDSVSDAATFLTFARLLAQDRVGAAKGWESETIEEFLESAIAWAEATDVGLTQGLASENPWKRFAVFLYCGKIYE